MKTVLFLGAGASVFAEMPTTEGMVGNVLRQTMHRESWESPAAQHLATEIVNMHGDKDVEVLYHTIHEMMDAEERHKVIVRHKGAGRKREIHATSRYHPDNVTVKDETDDIDENIRTLKSLKTAIRNTLLGSLVVKSDHIDDVVSTYDELFQHMPRNIVTTNYDNVLEAYCERAGLDLANGFTKSRLGDRRTWGGVWEDGENALHLVKLHGSITWQKDDNGMVLEFGRPGLRDIDKDVVIAPTLGEKDYKDGIFPELLDKFRTLLAEAELLIVIGFSFKDPGINQMFRERLRRTDGNPNPMRLLCVGLKPDGLKRLVDSNDEPREVVVYGKCRLWNYSQDGMPYVYAYSNKFNLGTAKSMKVVSEALEEVCDGAAPDQKS